jgi:hypothetical protein
VEIPDLTWPVDPTALFLETISDRFIDSIDHPVIQRFLGKA